MLKSILVIAVLSISSFDTFANTFECVDSTVKVAAKFEQLVKSDVANKEAAKKALDNAVAQKAIDCNNPSKSTVTVKVVRHAQS